MDFPGKEYRFDHLHVYVDQRTPVELSSRGTFSVMLIGIAVDVQTGRSNGIAEMLAESCASLDDVIRAEYTLGGKYILLISSHEGLYLIGDATCSIQVCYEIDREQKVCAIASDPYIIARKHDLTPDKDLLRVRRSGELFQPMPYNVTIFREILQLLPNHTLNLLTGETERYLYYSSALPRLSAGDAAKQILPYLDSMVKGYAKHFPLLVPITAGKDSRVVLAAVCRQLPGVKTYTMKHKKHRDDDEELVISKQLTARMKLPHSIYPDVELSEEQIQYFDQIIGKDLYSRISLTISATVHRYCSEYAVLNGDILDQIGKISPHRDIPECLATAGYFRCKLHNYSKEAKTLTKAWLREVKSSGEHLLSFDLFSIENRMGRWASQNHALDSYLGQVNLNIFNARRIIGILCCVDRKERMRFEIHKALLEQIDPDWLTVPFGKSRRAARLAKSNFAVFYCSGYLKYYLEKFRFRYRSR